jgi:hypothetical protein
MQPTRRVRPARRRCREPGRLAPACANHDKRTDMASASLADLAELEQIVAARHARLHGVGGRDHVAERDSRARGNA